MTRTRIENFCRGCLLDRFQLPIPRCYRNELLEIDLEFTRDGFESMFRRLCEDVLYDSATPRGRVIAVLCYAKVLRHRYRSWCCDEILVSVLTNVLVKIDFHPDDLITVTV